MQFMNFGQKLSCMRTLAAIVLLWPSTQSFGQVSTTELNLKGHLGSLGLSSSQIRTVAIVLGGNQGAWVRGQSEPTRAGSLALSGNGAASGINGEFKVRYNTLSPFGLSVESCLVGGVACNQLDLLREGPAFKTDAFGAQWNFDLYDYPCTSEFACAFTISSWSLKSRLQSPGGNLEVFPGIAAIVDTPNALMIMDAERNTPWMTWERRIGGNFSKVGKLIGAHLFAEDGILSLAFTHGHLVLHFAKDRIYMINDDGIFSLDDGIVAIDSASATSIAIKGGDLTDLGKVLAFSPNFVVWQYGLSTVKSEMRGLTFSSITQAAGINLAATYSPVNKGMTILSRSSDGTTRLTAYDANGTIDTPNSYSLDSSSIPSPMLIGSATFEQTGDGLFYIDRLGTRRPTTMVTKDPIQFLSPNHLFQQNNSSAGNACQWISLIQNPIAPQSFSESGLVIPCSENLTFSADEHAVAAATWNQFQVRIAISRLNR